MGDEVHGEHLLLQAGLAEQLRGRVEADEHTGHSLGRNGQQGVGVALEVDQLGQVGVLYEGLVQVAADQTPDLLETSEPPLLPLLPLPGLTGLQQDLDGRALLGQDQRVLQLLPLSLSK